MINWTKIRTFELNSNWTGTYTILKLYTANLDHLNQTKVLNNFKTELDRLKLIWQNLGTQTVTSY